MIAQDLWPTIVSYVSVDALYALSNAYPIFAKMICETGIKVFRQENISYEITKADKIIQTKSGIKYMLRRYGKLCIYYKLIGYDSSEIFQSDISYKPFAGRYDLYCEETRVAIKRSMYYREIFEDCDIKTDGNVLIVKQIDHNFNCIDFDNCIAMTVGQRHRIEYDDFVILFKDGQWQPHEKISIVYSPTKVITRSSKPSLIDDVCLLQ